MAFINSASTRRRMCLSAVALVSTALAGPIAGASAAGPSPRSPIPGFLLDRGRYITIEVRGARVETAAGGINERGQIVGTYDDGVSEHGFMRDQRGRIIPINVPGARSTAAFKINNRGQIVGVYSNTGPQTNDFNDPTSGFLLDRGKLTRIDVPGAVDTRTVGLNNRGQVVGEYTDAAGGVHGFLWDKGRFTTIDGPDGAGASATDINDRGQIIGALPFDRAGAMGLRGFLLSGGVYTMFEAPAALFTVPLDINNRAQVVGFTAPDLTQTAIHGFLRARGSRVRSLRSIFPALPKPWPSASTTAARSSASTRTPRPHPVDRRAPCGCR